MVAVPVLYSRSGPVGALAALSGGSPTQVAVVLNGVAPGNSSHEYERWVANMRPPAFV